MATMPRPGDRRFKGPVHEAVRRALNIFGSAQGPHSFTQRTSKRLPSTFRTSQQLAEQRRAAALSERRLLALEGRGRVQRGPGGRGRTVQQNPSALAASGRSARKSGTRTAQRAVVQRQRGQTQRSTATLKRARAQARQAAGGRRTKRVKRLTRRINRRSR